VKQICGTYIFDGSKVLDCTFGKGMFWKFEHNLELVTLDRFLPAQIQGDFRFLPFKDQIFDAAFFDPPYYVGAQTISKSRMMKTSSNFEPQKSQDNVRNLYMKGMMECSRSVKNKGIIVVKCSDGCPYYPMMSWIVDLKIGKYKDVVIRTNMAIRNFRTPGKIHKMKTSHSYFIVLQNSYQGSE